MSMLLVWCITLATYLLFAGTISRNELVTAGLLAFLAAGWAFLIWRISIEHFATRVQHLPPILRAVRGLVPATARTAFVLLTVIAKLRTPGRAVGTRFRFGESADPVERSRRALAVLCASLAPDRFVVVIERGRAEAILHVLRQAKTEPDAEWLQ